MKANRKFRIFAAWAVAAFILAGGAAGVMRAFAAPPPDKHDDKLKPFFKSDYPPEDSASRGLVPNILFFLDSSSAMLFDPRFPMPHVDDQRHSEGETYPQALVRRAKMLRNSTWGTGARNVSIRGQGALLSWFDEGEVQSRRIAAFDHERLTDTRQFIITSQGTYLVDVETEVSRKGAHLMGYSRFGRDINPDNNIIGDPNCYYTSKPDRPYFLTFKNRVLAWGMTSDNAMPPKPADVFNPPHPNGWENVTTVEYDAAKTSYNEIKDYLPTYNADGTVTYKGPVPLELANRHLVPNDSKVYMFKLALWNLTESTNAEILSKANIGVAKNYQDYTNYTSNLPGTFPIRGHALSEIPSRRWKNGIPEYEWKDGAQIPVCSDDPYAIPRERN